MGKARIDAPFMTPLADSDGEVIDVEANSRPASVGAAAQPSNPENELVFDDDNDAMLTAALTASLRTGTDAL